VITQLLTELYYAQHYSHSHQRIGYLLIKQAGEVTF